MTLLCPTCGAAVPADDVNIQTMTAACRACGAVFPFTHDDLAAEKRKREAPSLPHVLPDGLTEHRTNAGDSWLLDGRKARGSAEWLAAVVSGGLSLAGFGITLMMAPEAHAGDLPFVLPVLFALGTLVALYVALVALLGSVRFTVDHESLHIHYTPYWWYENARYPLSAITGLRTRVCKEFTGYEYLEAVLEDGSAKVIVLTKAPYTRYLRQALQQRIFGAEPAAEVHYTDALIIDPNAVEISDDGELVLRERPAAEAEAHHGGSDR